MECKIMRDGIGAIIGKQLVGVPGIDVHYTRQSGIFYNKYKYSKYKNASKVIFFTICWNLQSNVQCEVSELISLSPGLDEQGSKAALSCLCSLKAISKL